MADPEKKKRSRFGEEFHELFPQLVMPTALGLISSYNPMAAAGVRTGLEAADLFSVLRERNRQRALSENASKAMLSWADRAREDVAKREEDLRTTKGIDNARATLENTGYFRPGGVKMAVAFPTGSTEREQADQVPYFHEVMDLPIPARGVRTGSAIPGKEPVKAFAGLEPFGNIENEPMAEEWLPAAKEAADVSELKPELNFVDLIAAESILNPGAAANQAAWWPYQERGAALEIARMREQSNLMNITDEARAAIQHRLKTAEILLRAGKRVEAEREIAKIHAKPIPSQGGVSMPQAYDPKLGMIPYKFQAGPVTSGGGAKSYLSKEFEQMSQGELGERIRVLTAEARQVQDQIGDVNDEAVQMAWGLVFDAQRVYDERFGKQSNTPTGKKPGDIPDEWLQ